MKKRRFVTIWKHYNLSIVLAILFLSAWGTQFLVQLKKMHKEVESKGQAFDWGEFWPEFWTSTLENWQSEFLQLLTFVVLTGFLIHRGSPESRDGEDRVEKKIDQILKILKKDR